MAANRALATRDARAGGEPELSPWRAKHKYTGNPQIVAVFDELKRLGFVEGQNLTVEFRRFADRGDNSGKIATELVKVNVDAILCNGLDATRSVQALTRTIPILSLSDDMVGAGSCSVIGATGRQYDRDQHFSSRARR